MIICDLCHIGRLKSTTTAYVQPLGNQMLAFPFAPALVCDVCGRVQIDTLFTDIMDALISDHLDDERDVQLSRTWALGERYVHSHQNRVM